MGEEIVLCPSNFAVVCRSEVELSIVLKNAGNWALCEIKPKSPAMNEIGKFLTDGGSTTTAANTPRVNSISPTLQDKCEGVRIVRGDEAPLGGVAQVVLHGARVIEVDVLV